LILRGIMKIYLASFWEPENHGPGRKIGVSPSKPKNLKEECGYDCELCFPEITPDDEYWNYHKEKKAADGNDELLKTAGDKFVTSYRDRLDNYLNSISNSKKNVFDSFGLEDGDTLLSWEREGNTTYRTHLASFLREIGYEIEEH
jgi:hypothetical protein